MKEHTKVGDESQSSVLTLKYIGTEMGCSTLFNADSRTNKIRFTNQNNLYMIRVVGSNKSSQMLCNGTFFHIKSQRLATIFFSLAVFAIFIEEKSHHAMEC